MPTLAKVDPARASRLFQALSDPTRLTILLQLRRGERCVCELQDVTDAAQSRLSFHLRVLKDAGLLEARREGRWMFYAVKQEALDDLGQVLESLAPVPGAAAGCAC